MLMWQLRPAGHAQFLAHVGHLSQQLQPLDSHLQIQSQSKIWRKYCPYSGEIGGVRVQLYIHSFNRFFFFEAWQLERKIGFNF